MDLFCVPIEFELDLPSLYWIPKLFLTNNSFLRDVFAKGSKFPEPKSINWKHNFRFLMDSVEDYATQWEKRKKEDLDTLSEWMKSVMSLIQIRIKKLSGSMSTRSASIFKDPNVAKHLYLLHDKYGVVSADKTPNNIVFVCKSHPHRLLDKGIRY